jgi:tRNA(Ile)-lysidine synthase
LLVACSGGADSLALLAALAEIRDQDPGRGLALRAVHVDHGIHPDSASWARAVRAVARALAVPLSVRRAEVLARAGDSLEAKAREARYRVLARVLRTGETLVTAHHEDDQAETLLLQLLRGAGVAGLAAMPGSMPFATGLLVRPLLGTARSALRAWARLKELPWVEDPSNDDIRFDRNFLRRDVVPALLARWPHAPRVIARAAGHLGEARALLAELADLDLAAVQDKVATSESGALDIEKLRRFSLARQRNLMRRWLERSGRPPPDRLRLERILGEACDARPDALPTVVWPGAEIRRWRRRLYAMPPLVPAPGPLSWRHLSSPEIELPAGLGRLCLVRDPAGPLSVARLPRVLQVTFRAGGERLCTERGGPRRRLKELLRSGNVLPWMRNRIPLIRARGELLTVGDLWCNFDARAVAAVSARSTRARIEWRDAPAVF